VYEVQRYYEETRNIHALHISLLRLRWTCLFIDVLFIADQVYGRGKGDFLEVRRAAAKLFGMVLDDPVGGLMEVLADVLAREEILGHILCLQQLDLLDIEGAAMVLDRLVEVCDGQEDKALQLIGERSWRFPR